MSDQLIRDLRRGERKAVEDLYRNAFPYCSSIVLKNNGTMEHAKDLFQECILVLFKNIRKEDFKLNCDVKTYLYSVMRNLWLKEIRSSARMQTHSFTDDSEKTYVTITPEEIEAKRIEESKYQWVQQAMEKIKEDCKELLLSYYFKKMPLKEIAGKMDITYQFIKVKKNRCMNYLKNEIAKLKSSR